MICCPNQNYHLRIYFKFVNYNSVYRSDHSIYFSIPADPKKDQKTKVALYLVDREPFIQVPLMQLADVVLEGYQEGSASGIQAFSKLFDSDNNDVGQYKMLLPYILALIPELTVDAASRLKSNVTKRTEAATENSNKISGLKTPDLEEAIGLLSPKK